MSASTLPYGSWPSPITAADVAQSGHPVGGARFVAGEPWWTELRPAEGGRLAVRRLDGDGDAIDVLPAPWNARTRVHEYGGGAWTVTDGGALVFAEFTDQRLYRLDAGADTPVAITPEPPQPLAWRYGGLSIGRDSDGVWCIRESHDEQGGVRRDLCAVPLDGSAVDDPSKLRSVVAGSDFLAHPRLSPDGRRLAWLAWNHPQMPWDGTEIRVGELNSAGQVASYRTVVGSPTESVLQPEWHSDDVLHLISDRTGWWNLYRLRLAEGAEPEPLCPIEADMGGPMWQLGTSFYLPLDDGRLVTTATLGTDRLVILDPATGKLDDVTMPGIGLVRLDAVSNRQLLLRCGGPRVPAGLRRLDLDTGALSDVRLGVDSLPELGYLSEAQPMTFPGLAGRDVHAIVYPPHNRDAAGPDGERPPYVAFVHGGPTAHVPALLDVEKAYFTSRGIGVVDVNYGGSTGYGRAYRERLRGQWGVVDVEDTVAAMQGLVDAGLADGDRLAIRGGSAGGWTVLASLTGTDTFCCGASYFGVAELLTFAATTHDFESRYLDGLIGPLPESRELYDARAPLSHVDDLSCPVLLLQGLDDPVVPPEQAELFRDAMVRKGIPHAYRPYEGESHGFRRSETVIDSLESELSFYGQVMGFTPPGVPTLELWRPAEGSSDDAEQRG
jgi:dipeptidyl aminopeptidase/acylaminoacyl peptidase